MIANNWSRLCVCVCVCVLPLYSAKLLQFCTKHFSFPHKKYSGRCECIYSDCASKQTTIVPFFHHLLKGLAPCSTDGIITSASNPHLLQHSQPLGRAFQFASRPNRSGVVPIALIVRTAWRAVPRWSEWLASTPLYWPCTRAPQDCVLSPLLYFLSTPDHVVTPSSNLSSHWS